MADAVTSIRTISDLRQTESVASNDLFEVSRLISDGGRARGYASESVSYATLSRQFSAAAVNAVRENLSASDGVNIDSVAGEVSALSGAISVDSMTGKAVFTVPPQSPQKAVTDADIPNRKDVIELVQTKSGFIGNGSVVTASPNNDSGQTYVGQGLLQWHIPSGSRDSTDYYDPDTRQYMTDGIRVPTTGYLVTYGWFSAPSQVEPSEAWIALYGYLVDRTGQRKWMALQVQPWVIGQHSQSAQYVGFSVPVQAGLRLKVKTGFQVTAMPSGMNRGNALMFKSEGWVPNTLVGYVVENTVGGGN